MGTVYRAVRDDDAFQKTVALKLVRGGAAPRVRASAASARSGRSSARLQHPNIATILDGGTTEEGQPYLVMEYVEGKPITAYCDDRGPRHAASGSRSSAPCAPPSSTPTRTSSSTAT